MEVNDFTTFVICEQCGKIVDFHYPQLDEVEQLAQHVTDFNVTPIQ
jgi:Fur family peroxide stress response transcriptional regulator